jgi:adenylosuccinate synthase
MSTLAVVGAQWGDEGKGKVVDVLAASADVVARYSGGNNAGHTLVIDGKKIVTHLVPSGCTRPGTTCVLGNGMVVDPEVLQKEVANLQASGLLLGDELKISYDAHVIFEFHRRLDGLREDATAGAQRIGTTRRGIGPAYEAKAGRRGVRVRDLFVPERLRERLLSNAEILDPELARLGSKGIDVDAALREAEQWVKFFAPKVVDASALLNDAIKAGKSVLFEGAQGALLDVDHGTYPFVTSTNTIAGGVCAGLGIGPTRIDAVWGITKAYTTRVGGGPFPTRLAGDIAHRLREAGGEYGATTGRPRDVGWLDLPALRHAARVNGLTGLCVTKVDVLAMIPEAALCVAYRDGVDPGRDGYDHAVPVLEPISGWGEPGIVEALSAAKVEADLPPAVRGLLDRIEAAIDVPVTLLSTGADRGQTMLRAEPFPRQG